MNIEMREEKHLWVRFNPSKGDPREIIIDEEHRDIRICDGKHVVKAEPIILNLKGFRKVESLIKRISTFLL